MQTVEIRVDTPEQAEKFLRGYDCPAVDAFLTDFVTNGSCRFIGITSKGDEVSVLIVSLARPAAATTA